MHTLNLFTRTALVWLVVLPTFSFDKASGNEKEEIESRRYYADGIELSQAKYWKEASDEFRKAIELNPAHKLAYANLGVALSQMGKQKEALLAFDEAINLGYNHALLRYNRGLSFSKLGLKVEYV